MKRFRNILVGVDLFAAEELVASELGPGSRAAVEQSLRLAAVTGAELTFFAVLDRLIGPTPLLTPQQVETAQSNVQKAAGEALERLVNQACGQGVRAQLRTAFGRAWMEIVREVLLGRHDLVVVGSRNLSALERLVVGSTGAKLLRKCPCAVWVTEPRPAPEISAILAATDFSPVSKFASGLAASLAEMHGAALHLLHAVEYPLLGALKFAHVPAEYRNDYRQRVYAEAQHEFDLELNRPEFDSLPERPHVHLKADEPPHRAILEAIDELKIDLLVMGTVARGGVRGLLVGNTAERILPNVPCSILAVKPGDFLCPIEVEPDAAREASGVRVAGDLA